MTRIRSAFILLLGTALVALLVAPAQAHAQKKRQRDLVTREEIGESAQAQSDLFAALRSLRPRFLEPPPGIRTITAGEVKATVVVVDGKPMGGLETLQSIMASTVDEVRYLEPTKAGNEFGSMAEGGAVVVKLYKSPKVTKQAPADSAQKPSR